MVDWKEKINFEGWPDWVAGPNGWLRCYANKTNTKKKAAIAAEIFL